MKGKTFSILILAVIMLTSLLAGCTSSKEENTPSTEPAASTNSSGVDISKEVKLVYYLWGSEGVANKDILAEINKLLKRDINATLEVKYIDWPDIATKIRCCSPLARSSIWLMRHQVPRCPIIRWPDRMRS